MRSLSLSCVATLLACSTGTDPEGGLRFTDIAAGARHTCAITADGRAFCWGANQFGQLGNGSHTSAASPVPAVTAPPFASVSAGFNHTCAVGLTGRLYCWGGNFNGELGDGSTTDRTVPTPVQSPASFRMVTTGESHTCAISNTGDGYCWGAPLGAIPGVSGRPPNVLVPEPLPLDPLADVTVGYEIACAATAETRTAYCWGRIPPGVELGPDEPSPGIPKLVAGAPALAVVSAGHKHACGIGLDGATYCWGRNSSGQAGVGAFSEDVAPPQAVVGGYIFVSLAAHSPAHTCALDAEGRAYCWGANAFGQLGDGTRAPTATPVPVTGGLRFHAISTGFAHTCAIADDGRAFCWGAGELGQLGTGLLADTAAPVPVG